MTSAKRPKRQGPPVHPAPTRRLRWRRSIIVTKAAAASPREALTIRELPSAAPATAVQPDPRAVETMVGRAAGRPERRRPSGSSSSSDLAPSLSVA